MYIYFLYVKININKKFVNMKITNFRPVSKLDLYLEGVCCLVGKTGYCKWVFWKIDVSNSQRFANRGKPK